MQQDKQHRFSIVFRHACKAFAIYLLLWTLMIVMILIGAIFECLPALASLVFWLMPSMLRLGLILLVGAIAVIFREGLL